MKFAVFTLESLANARAVRRFIADHSGDIVFVGISNPYRPSAGGGFGQFLRHLRRSGLRFLPFLGLNFSLPGILALFAMLWPGRRAPEITPLARVCRERGIPTIVVNDLNSEATRTRLRESGAELIVSFHFDQIFDAATIAAAPRGGVNVHPSLLPLHRGPVPTYYALLETPPVFGVTVHRIVEKIDAGAILLQQQVTLPAGISALGATIALHERGRHLLEQVLSDLEAHTGALASASATVLPYCPFPSPAALKEAAARGVALVHLSDLWTALRTVF